MRVLAAFFLLGLVSAAQAETAVVQRIDVTEYGLYTSNATSVSTDEQGIKHSITENLRLAATTRTVPMQQGVEFGFRFTVVGTPKGAKVPLRVVVTYPSPGLVSPAVSHPILHAEEKITETIGTQSFKTYKLEDPWEVVAGNWTLEIWYGDERLTAQTFTVVKE